MNLPKFRVWDKTEEKMWEVESLHVADDRWVRINDGSIFSFTKHLTSDLVLMQYSYRAAAFIGDVIEHTYMSYAGNGHVEELTDIIVLDDIENLPFDTSSINVEVLGNIYENPELLGDKGCDKK